ncbi:MAG: prepilin-type N-terminal cleavage/methylation domain-containing protein [Acidobacteria bacterium]|nr:prepilin-type N-terminal cleavage/methylation domain-containing protein [Acidobacteriota bacterium]
MERFASNSRAARSISGERGFSLIEVLISVSLLSITALGVAQLFAVAGRANIGARGQTSTAVLAVQKMEQLRSLTWGYDRNQNGSPVQDTTTDLSRDPAGTGGTGLQPTPSDALDANTPPYVDYLDADGRWIGNGGTPPLGTVYIRRWSIAGLPTAPNNTLVLQVVVIPLRRELMKGSGLVGSLRDETRIMSLKTRKAS